MNDRRPYRHGLNVLKTRIKTRGINAIDRRTAAARELLAWKADFVNDLGDQDNLSAQQRGWIDLTEVELVDESPNARFAGVAQRPFINPTTSVGLASGATAGSSPPRRRRLIGKANP